MTCHRIRRGTTEAAGFIIRLQWWQISGRHPDQNGLLLSQILKHLKPSLQLRSSSCFLRGLSYIKESFTGSHDRCGQRLRVSATLDDLLLASRHDCIYHGGRHS